MSIGHFSARAFAAAISRTVTRPGLRPPYSGSDLSAAPVIEDAPVTEDDWAAEDDWLIEGDWLIDGDIAETSKVSRRPAGVPGRFDNRTPEAWEDTVVPSIFASSAAASGAPLAISFAAADEIVRRFHERGGQPAISYGIVRDGVLVHAAGFGARSLGRPVLDGPVLDGPAPDERTVFRIASMSKSFTASAIMLLRDAGALSLDDPAATYAAELDGWVNGAADAGPLTIRHLLTMTAGFPTDDPWGDRQQGLPLDEFDALLARGVMFNWAPGTRFEYSNLGYSVLGRIVTAASGLPYDEFVRTRLLSPLGMSRTGFAAEEFPAADLATGYRRGLGGWEELPFDPYGAFAPMGGVFSCVADLAIWSAGFAAAFPPDGAPRRRRSSIIRWPPGRVRQMQLPQAVTGWRAPDRIPGGPPTAPSYYGFGLFVDEDPAFGRVVSHSGGYPGFGSNMRWHPATGLAVIALGNGTYSPMYALADLVLKALLAPSPSYHVALAPVSAASAPADTAPAVTAAAGPWPQTLAAADAVNRLLQDWDDATADALFTENVALDRPYRERLRDLALIRDRIGRVRRRSRSPGGVRHPGAAPLVAGRGAGHGRGDDPAQPAAAPARPVPHDRGTAGTGIGARPGAGNRHPVAERRRRRLARLAPGRTGGRRGPDRPAAADGGRLGRPGDPRGVPGRRRSRVGDRGTRRRARPGGSFPAGQRRDRGTAPGRCGGLAYGTVPVV